jgi:chemotaxis protein MotB
MAKRQHHEEHENHERWLVSYADFITLLFAFFVVMYAVSSVDQKRVVQAEKSVRWAMHFKGEGGSSTFPLHKGPPAGGAGVLGGDLTPMVNARLWTAEQVRSRLEQRLGAMLPRSANSGGVHVEVEGRTLRVRMNAGQLFDANSAALRPDALPTLDLIMEEVVPLKRPLRVDGHTDGATPSGRYTSNWELSAARAAAVVLYLQAAHQVPGNLLSLAGFGASRPLETNANVAGRDLNRRIELNVEFEAGSHSAQPKAGG